METPRPKNYGTKFSADTKTAYCEMSGAMPDVWIWF